MGQKVSICTTQMKTARLDSHDPSRANSQEETQLTSKKVLDGKMKKRMIGQKRLVGRTTGTVAQSTPVDGIISNRDQYDEEQSLNKISNSIFKSLTSAQESQEHLRNYMKDRSTEQNERDDFIDLSKQKAMKIRISWNYGGQEVYIIGSFTNWDYMIKMNKCKSQLGQTQHQISMYVKAGVYYYYFIVDGQIRFAPDQPSTIHKSKKIVNFVGIDNYMIQKAEEARDNKVKNMAECVASENSWRFSQQFEKNCKERCQIDIIDDEFKFSIEMQSFDESCKACYLTTNDKSKSCIVSNDQHDTLLCGDYRCAKRHQHFYPSSSFMEFNELQRFAQSSTQREEENSVY